MAEGGGEAAIGDGPTAPISRGQIAAAVIGNGLEFYDFTTYALFATQIGRTFFPGTSPFASLMLSLMAFAGGFVGRPVGAVVIGAIGDRLGRRPAMMLSFSLMGVGLIGLVLIPSYAAIGAAAPVLLVLCRLVQGFALGGEVGPTTAFLVEAAPLRHRGFVAAWQSASQAAANLIAAAIGVVLTQTLNPAQLDSFGWRIAFALGAVVLPFGHLRPLLLGLGMIMSFTTSTYVLLYMTTYASQTLHMSAADSFGASVANGACGLVFALAGGALSDRLGRRPVMITARTLFLLATFPAFVLMVRNHNALTLLLCTGLLSALSSASVGVAIVALTESLRKDVRSTGLAVVYAVGVAVFGGVAQPYVTLLIKATGSAMAPAWYMMAAAGVGIVAMALLPESRPLPAAAAEAFRPLDPKTARP